jgi:3-phenylpropionate/cinnamic acid dioxygenase small subunit
MNVEQGLSDQVARFYALETALLDDNKFHEWLDLIDDDVLYKMPMRETRLGEAPQEDGPTFFLFNDDKQSLETRVARLDTGFALVESPPSATQRLVTDILILDVEAGHVDARSSFMVFQVRDERNETVFTGRRIDRLRIIENGLRLLRRDILLAHYVLPRTISLFF